MPLNALLAAASGARVPTVLAAGAIPALMPPVRLITKATAKRKAENGAEIIPICRCLMPLPAVLCRCLPAGVPTTLTINVRSIPDQNVKIRDSSGV